MKRHIIRHKVCKYCNEKYSYDTNCFCWFFLLFFCCFFFVIRDVRLGLKWEKSGHFHKIDYQYIFDKYVVFSWCSLFLPNTPQIELCLFNKPSDYLNCCVTALRDTAYCVDKFAPSPLCCDVRVGPKFDHFCNWWNLFERFKISFQYILAMKTDL